MGLSTVNVPNVLVTLTRLLQQVETAFPRARAFLRPGFDTGA